MFVENSCYNTSQLNNVTVKTKLKKSKHTHNVYSSEYSSLSIPRLLMSTLLWSVFRNCSNTFFRMLCVYMFTLCTVHFTTIQDISSDFVLYSSLTTIKFMLSVLFGVTKTSTFY